MPYIPQEERRGLKGGLLAGTPGQLNYVFYNIFLEQWKKSPRYSTIHSIHKNHAPIAAQVYSNGVDKTRLDQRDVESAFELAFFEFYRRVAALYEDKAIAKNGDIGEVRDEKGDTVSERSDDGKEKTQSPSVPPGSPYTSKEGV